MFYCVCLVTQEIVKLKTSGGKAELFKAQKAYVVMSKHPFLSFHMDALAQVV